MSVWEGLIQLCMLTLQVLWPFSSESSNPFLPHRQLIYNYPEQLFADAGVMAIEHADFEGIERLSLVLGQ